MRREFDDENSIIAEPAMIRFRVKAMKADGAASGGMSILFQEFNAANGKAMLPRGKRI